MPTTLNRPPFETLPFLARKQPVNTTTDSVWDQVVQDLARRVFAVAYRILGSVHEAEDATQDAFTQAWQIHQTQKVESWTGLLVRLASTRALDRLRRKSIHQPVRDEDRISHSSPGAALEEKELRSALLDQLLRLSEQQATVFWMAAIEQIPREDIASTLNLSPEAVSTTLYKARKHLANALNEFIPGGRP
jgi:RNA polymerase sigma-70 factor (ECF subfamily)